ncbi:hypothetical protein QWZ13_09520 [Reinekea marina]|nr:hypothetical protein [Reinekea marina]MDN3649148.1 hypothetical protein [Reinekea marina]
MKGVVGSSIASWNGYRLLGSTCEYPSEFALKITMSSGKEFYILYDDSDNYPDSIRISSELGLNNFEEIY